MNERKITFTVKSAGIKYVHACVQHLHKGAENKGLQGMDVYIIHRQREMHRE